MVPESRIHRTDIVSSLPEVVAFEASSECLSPEQDGFALTRAVSESPRHNSRDRQGNSGLPGLAIVEGVAVGGTSRQLWSFPVMNDLPRKTS